MKFVADYEGKMVRTKKGIIKIGRKPIEIADKETQELLKKVKHVKVVK